MPDTDKIMKTENDNTSSEVPLVLTGIRIDADVLRAKGACEDGFRAFTTRWPNGCDYQEALHWLAEINRADWASWLMRKIGSAQTETIIEGSLKVGNLFVAGHLVVRGSIEAGGNIEAGCGIEAGGSIKAGRSIEAGRSIKAGRSIEAGGNIKATWSIKAGGNIKATWSIEAGRSIKAGWGIEAGRGIEAGWGIKAGCGIEAGWGIEAGRGIEADRGIEAGWGIEATWIDCALRIFAGLVNRRLPTPEEMEIRAEIRRGTVAYGTLVETNRKA